MNLFKKTPDNRGQILSSVLVFMAFGLSVIALSAALTIINIQNTSKYIESANTLNYAEAGAEEAIIRLIRDSNYNGGSFTLGTASISVSVTGAAPNKTVVSTATCNGFVSKIQLTLTVSNGKISLVSWKQIT